MHDAWESDIAALLAELANVQSSLLEVLTEKRQLLARGDTQSLVGIAGRERELVDRLQACHDRRQQLLEAAKSQGLPADSICSLSTALPVESRGRLAPSLAEAAERSRFLQHQSLTNWVLVQRSLLHLSQLVEIIATGGRLKPTYGNGSNHGASGALVDQAA